MKNDQKSQPIPSKDKSESHKLRAYVNRMVGGCTAFVAVAGAVTLILVYGRTYDAHEARDNNSAVVVTRIDSADLPGIRDTQRRLVRIAGKKFQETK